MSQIKCTIQQKQLIDYLLNELSLDETSRLDDHIRSCKKCTEESNNLLKIFSHLKEKPQPQIKSDLYFSLKSKVNEFTEKKKTPIRSYPKLSLLLSAAVVLLFTMTTNFNLPVRTLNSDLAHESWFIDSSSSNIQTIYDIHDSLFYKSHKENKSSMQNMPIKLKDQATIINTDILSDHYYFDFYRKGTPKLNFWFREIISNRINRKNNSILG